MIDIYQILSLQLKLIYFLAVILKMRELQFVQLQIKISFLIKTNQKNINILFGKLVDLCITIMSRIVMNNDTIFELKLVNTKWLMLKTQRLSKKEL